MTPVRTAVVGLGYWGPNLVRNLFELPSADVVLVCDSREEALEQNGRRYPAVRRTTEFDDVSVIGLLVKEFESTLTV